MYVLGGGYVLQPLFALRLHTRSRFASPHSIFCFMREVDGSSRLLVKNSLPVPACTCSSTSLWTPSSYIYKHARKLRQGPKYRPCTSSQKNVCCSIWGLEILLLWGRGVGYIQNFYNYLNYIVVNPA